MTNEEDFPAFIESYQEQVNSAMKTFQKPSNSVQEVVNKQMSVGDHRGSGSFRNFD